jgi:hypothetical protein
VQARRKRVLSQEYVLLLTCNRSLVCPRFFELPSKRYNSLNPFSPLLVSCCNVSKRFAFYHLETHFGEYSGLVGEYWGLAGLILLAPFAPFGLVGL